MKVFVNRMGSTIPADEAFFAWTSGDLARMTAALSLQTNPIDRHFLLSGIVSAAYKRRGSADARRICVEVARQHLQEFPVIAEGLRAEMGGNLPRITTFACLASLLTEDGLFDEAIKVCRAALAHGIHDGTNSGFAARIARIRKKLGNTRRISGGVRRARAS